MTARRCRKKHLGTLPQGTGFDLLNGTARRRRDDVELYPTSRALSLPFGKATHPETAVFTPDGDSLVTGSVDGFVEVRFRRSARSRFRHGHLRVLARGDLLRLAADRCLTPAA